MFTAKLLCRSPAYLLSKRCSRVCLTTLSPSASFTFTTGGVKQTSLFCPFRRSIPGQTEFSSSRLPTRCLSTNAHSEDGTLIYNGSLSTAVRGVKFFSYSTSGASLALMPQILLKTGVGVQSVALQASFCVIIGFFTFLTPVILHLTTKGYVIRLYHQPDTDTYTAITYSVFLTEKKRVFHQSQVRIPAISKMFTSFYANGMGLLVNPDAFVLPNDFNHLMGYDKPFSFSSDDMDPSKKS